MLKKLRARLAQYLVKLLKEAEPEEPALQAIDQIPKFISVDSLLTLTNKGWYIGKRRLLPDQASILKAEAREFGNSFLWKLIRNDIHYQAYLQGTAKRRTDMDAIYAGAMYKDLEILEEFIERCNTRL